MEPGISGSKATLSKVRNAIFAFQTRASESRLLRPLLWQGLTAPQRYTTLERYPLFLAEEPWCRIRATNGAAMLATAVALQPARLIVSGIDLFSHPEGSYPGDKETANAYTPGHRPDSELSLLLEALGRYRGDLVILSPALKAAWGDHRAGEAPREMA